MRGQDGGVMECSMNLTKMARIFHDYTLLSALVITITITIIYIGNHVYYFYFQSAKIKIKMGDFLRTGTGTYYYYYYVSTRHCGSLVIYRYSTSTGQYAVLILALTREVVVVAGSAASFDEEVLGGFLGSGGRSLHLITSRRLRKNTVLEGDVASKL